MTIPLDRARELVLAAAAPLRAELVAVADAAGRVVAREVRARTDSPPDTNSAMDGFAVSAGAAERTLRLVGESRAGAPAVAGVDRATAIRIATGGVLPVGAEAVVPVERTSVAGDRVTVPAIESGANVRWAGEDMRRGQLVLAAGRRLGAAELAVAVGAGYGELECHRRPRVALLGTGDELREPGSRLEAGQIHDSNTVALAALAGAAGGVVVHQDRIGDAPARVRTGLARAFEGADLVVISGGVSVGRHDHVKAELDGLGAEELFWGVAIRPGRPTWFGRRGGVLVLGLPGNPVAAMIIFMLLGRPLLGALEGAAAPPRARARLSRPVCGHPARTEAVGVRLEYGADGLAARPLGPPGAHMTTSLIAADGVALVPAAAGELAAGTVVEVERLWP